MRGLVLVVVCALGCVSREEPTIAKNSAPLTAAGSLAAPRELFAWTMVKGQPFLSGGFDATGSSLQLQELFDPSANTWSRAKDSLESHAAHTVTYFPAIDKVLIVGEDSEMLDLAINKWVAEPGPDKRLFHTSTLLASGKLLVVGGETRTTPPVILGAALYDPTAAAGSRWSAAGTMVKLRLKHTATPLDSGKVLVAGGYDEASSLDDSELYDPATNTWTSTTALNDARRDHVVTRLADGRVLVAGGVSGSALSSAEIFDPKTSKWSYTADLPEPRDSATATLLASGRVLVVGGDGTAAGTTTVFDPKTSTWSKGPALTTARYLHAAIPITLGRILIVAGYGTDGKPLASSEIFGGLASGATCVIDEECLSGKCTGGVCAGSSGDAGPDTPAVDATPPDASAKPVASGDFKSCTAGSQCSSGFCVDGVCCDSACTSSCHSCALPWAPGTCTLEPYGTDHKNACGASGTCVSTCDGKGGCVPAAAGTQCGIARCTGPSTGEGPAVCTAAGSACGEGARIAFDCAPFACEPALAACLSTCIESSDCAPGFLCDAPSRTCVATPPASDSGGCSLAGRSSQLGGAGLVALLALAGRMRRRR